MKHRPNLIPDLKVTKSGKDLTLSTNRLASYVWIYRVDNGQHLPLHLSENYFTMTANTTKTIEVGDVPMKQLEVTCFELEFQAEKGNKGKLTIEEEWFPSKL